MARTFTTGLCLLLCTSVIGQTPPNVRDPKLLVIVLGGFRWDFLNYTMGEGFRRMREEGIKAEYLEPIFPSLTSPNLYSLMTGRFPSDHGIIGDRMYDEVTEGWFMDLENSVPQQSWWEAAEPLWITASRSNLRTELYWWPGCEAGIDDVRPDICEPYKGLQPQLQDPLLTWRNSLSQTIDKFAQNTVNMVAYYVDHILMTAKTFGINPQNPEFRRAIRNVDNIIREALDNLRIRGLDKEVTVVIASDHGVSEINYQSVVNLNEYVDERDILRVLDNGAIYGIDPEPNALDRVYEGLKQIRSSGVKILKESEIPSSWHYRFTRHCPAIIAVAEPGTVLRWRGSSNKLVSGPNPWNEKVISGYDATLSQDMRGIFFIKGPDFKSGVTHGPFSTTDIYNVISNVLRLQPLSNQGIWNRVKNMFIHPDMFSAAYRLTATSMLFGVASAVICLTIYH